MKKKVIALVLACVMLTGCEEVEVSTSPSLSSVDMEYSTFDLIQDEKTCIVYIDNVVRTYDGTFWKSFHVYTPYYSKNGKICRYVDGRVVEIE